MHVIVIGSGIAGITFAEKYRTLSPDSAITVITWEQDGYYSRPLLSRGFTKTDIEHTIILKSFETLRENGINVVEATVTAIDRPEQQVKLLCKGNPQTLGYDHLVLALGSAAFIPPPYHPFTELFYCLNSLADLKHLRRFRQTFLDQQQHPHWAIIGGGLIGCEVASDLATAGDKVTLYHAMDRLMERQLAAEDSITLRSVLAGSGVNVLLSQQVKELLKHEGKVRVTSDVTAEFDAVIVSCGFKPRIDLAQQAGLEVTRGIKVNGYLQTSDPAIFALGDVAQLPNEKLYAFIMPIRNQALWLAHFLTGETQEAWTAPDFSTKAKVHGFEAAHPYQV